jgi:hypothetical protein
MQDRSHGAHRLGWKTNLGTLHAVLQSVPSAKWSAGAVRVE